MSEPLPSHNILEAILPTQNQVREGYFAASHTIQAKSETASCKLVCDGGCSG